MGRAKLNPRLAEAGPGAGKTHTMVDKIAAAMQVLPPHRFLAAITYTNAAANTIRKRLAKRVPPTRNVFVGTTHSFVNRFVLTPFAELYDLLPEDRLYAPIDIHAKGRGASIYAGNLIKKGIVPYDTMIPTARKILKCPGVRDRICGRFAFLFVDEFQDTDTGMFEVLEHFRKVGKTVLYAVGDPEQYVMGFAYRGQRTPAHDRIPFFRFKKLADPEPIIENHRSNKEIVTFANHFREELRQKAVKPQRTDARVMFIPETGLVNIVQRFQALSIDVECNGDSRKRLYLSEENATYESVREQFQLKPLSNLGRKNGSLLGEALEILSTALDCSQRKAHEKYRLSRLGWRSYGIEFLKNARNDDFTIEHLADFVNERFSHKVSKSRLPLLQESLTLLNAELLRENVEESREQYASIRKAKGLEADAVLVIAKRVAELKRWFSVDRKSRVADKQDKCRLGYVAFTRPREMLCIACLQKIDDETSQLVKDLGVTFVG